MKTKSFLFASLLTFSFAITSCQKEETIKPAGIDQYSMGTTDVPSRKLTKDNVDAVIEEQQTAPNQKATKDAGIIRIGKTNIDDIK